MLVTTRWKGKSTTAKKGHIHESGPNQKHILRLVHWWVNLNMYTHFSIDASSVQQDDQGCGHPPAHSMQSPPKKQTPKPPNFKTDLEMSRLVGTAAIPLTFSPRTPNLRVDDENRSERIRLRVEERQDPQRPKLALDVLHALPIGPRQIATPKDLKQKVNLLEP